MQPLRVVTSGICCSVGFHAAAALVAIRAKMDLFSETGFVDNGGEPIVGAMLPEVPVWGDDRFQFMYRSVMSECLSSMPDDRFPPLILLGAERDRGERFAKSMHGLLWRNRPSEDYAQDTHWICEGKAGIGQALLLADEILSRHDAPEYVLVVGVDSYLDAATINYYLQKERVRCSTNPDGFIPGEAGAAIVLSRKPGGASLWIEGLGQGHEAASPEGGTPMRARGLTVALRQAMENAGTQSSDYRFHASGVSGEQWFFNEASIAVDRVMTHKADTFPHELVCQSVGEVGSACGPLALAWLADAMGRGEDQGLPDKGLLHLANDDGQRMALALHYRE